MDISEYRTQFSSFNSSLELARYQKHVGLKSQLTAEQPFRDYSDLFSAAAIADLKSQIEQTPSGRETEQAALAKLLNAARRRFAQTHAREIEHELDRCESASGIKWKGNTISFRQVLFTLAREPNKTERDDLASRWIDAISNCNDLRAAKFDSLNNSAAVLGFDSYRRLSLETTGSSPDYEKTTRSLLEQTESAYKNALSNLAGRDFPHVARDSLSFADLSFLREIPWVDRYLGTRDVSQIQAEMMAGLGIRFDQKRKIQVDIEARDNRNPSAASFAVNTPHDVRVAASLENRASTFLDSFECMGQALHDLWSSPERARRYPEFVFSPDSSTRRSYGFLFRYLGCDPRWTLEFISGLSEEQATQTARDIGLNLAININSLGANELCLQDVRDDDQSANDEEGQGYADLHQRAVSFRRLGELCLIDLDVSQVPLVELRALAFAFVLREYFRIRYGYRWWGARKAGDELIDLWDTASRYSVEELTSQIGFGELNFDILTETVKVALMGAQKIA